MPGTPADDASHLPSSEGQALAGAGELTPAAGAGGDPGANPARVYLSLLAAGGRATMTGCAEALARFLSGAEHGIDTFPWAGVGHADVAMVRAALAQAVSEARYSPSTARKYLACLKGVMRASWRLGLVSTDHYQRAVDVPPIRGRRMLAGREVPAGERQELLAVRAGGTGTDVRDRAIVATLYLGGLRRSELAGLDLTDLNRGGPSLLVRGKGDRERLVPLAEAATEWLDPWLGLRGESAGPLFCAVDRTGAPQVARRLSGEAVRQAVLRRAARAGVAAPSPHDLRRTYAGDLLDAGADLVVVSALMGHASVQTTARYDRRGERAAATAARRLTP